MKNLAVARRYAKALLLIGKEDGQTDSYRKELSGFADLMEQEDALNQAITNPLYESTDRRNVLQAVIDKLDISRTMKSFLLLIFDKGRIGFIGSINDFYQKLADELLEAARVRAERMVQRTEVVRAAEQRARQRDGSHRHPVDVVQVQPEEQQVATDQRARQGSKRVPGVQASGHRSELAMVLAEAMEEQG